MLSVSRAAVTAADPKLVRILFGGAMTGAVDEGYLVTDLSSGTCPGTGYGCRPQLPIANCCASSWSFPLVSEAAVRHNR